MAHQATDRLKNRVFQERLKDSAAQEMYEESSTIYLITTELEATWPTGGRVIFLGEWCRLYSRREEWQAFEGTMLPYHWDNRKKLKCDFERLQILNQKLLEELVPIMNELHGVSHDLRYWRLLLGYWLNLYTAVLFDRWVMIGRAEELGCSLTSLVLPDQENMLAVDNTDEFVLKSTDDPVWNHAIFVRLLKRYPKIRLEEVSIDEVPAREYVRNNRKILSCIKGLLKRFVASSIWLKKRDLVALVSTYLPKKALWHIEAKFGQIPAFWDIPQLPSFPYKSDKRSWCMNTAIQGDEFERIVREMLPKVMPRVFLEGFDDLSVLTKNMPWPESPKVIWTSNLHFHSDIFKAWAAEKCNAGARLIISEHGGFGVGAFNGSHAYELSVADRYLSSGWSDESNPRIFPIGNFRQLRQSAGYNPEGHALLVCGVMPRYSFDMRSMMISSQVSAYFEDQFIFVKTLPQDIRRELLVRLYSTDYGWEQAARWNERCPEVPLDAGKVAIWDLIRQTRLFISTYCATTYLESMFQNIPTIMFWNPEHWELREQAQPFFMEFERVGIFHRSPQSAASHVTQIWHDIDSWWSSLAVQSARKDFLSYYAANPPDMLERIESAVREEMVANQTAR